MASSPRGSMGFFLLALGLAATLLIVGASQGLPSTHWTVYGFYKDGLGLSEAASNQAAAITRKAFHVPAYGFLAFLLSLALRGLRGRDGVVLGLVLAVAIADELLQSFQPGRTGSARDVAIDCVGAVLGILAARWVLGRRVEVGGD